MPRLPRLNIVCFLLVKKGRALLMQRRLKPQYQYGKWTFPWASKDEGENADETATRILKEQLGVEGPRPILKEILHLDDGFPWKPEAAAKDFVLVYDAEGPGEVHPSPDLSEVKYLEPYEIIKDPDLHHFHRDIAQALGIGWKPLGISLDRPPT